MRHLPTETVLQIMEDLPKPDLMALALVASRYSTLTRPILFKRIRLLFASYVLPYWVKRIAEYPNRALMIKTIEIGSHWSKTCFEGVRNLIRAAVTLEELTILTQRQTIPPELFDPVVFRDIRKLAITSDADHAWLAVDFLPHCPKLVDLEVPHLHEQWAWAYGFASVLERYAPSFMNRLHKFRGPLYFLHYMSKTGRALQHFSATTGITDAGLSYLSNELGFGDALLSLHVVIAPGFDSSYHNWVERHCITPLIIPSLFPNLRSVAWFPVQHLLPERQFDQSNDSNDMGASEPLISPNAELLAAIKHLPNLRRVYLTSYHRPRDGPFPEVINTFIAALQKEADVAVPHLTTISIWAAGSNPWSYIWKKGYVDSDNGRTRLDWISTTNEITNPDH